MTLLKTDAEVSAGGFSDACDDAEWLAERMADNATAEDLQVWALIGAFKPEDYMPRAIVVWRELDLWERVA